MTENSTAVAVAEQETTSLVQLAIERGNVDVEVLERLVALEERVSERRARKAFFDALARFQAEVGPITKTKIIPDNSGNERSRYAPLSAIAEHIRGPLSRNGLMYSWDSSVDADGVVDIWCIVRHVDGHEERSRFSFFVKDAAAPKMNGVQIAGSARTYGERYSLIQALGLTTADPDDDGNGVAPAEPITEAQEADLNALIDETGADREKFLAFMGVESLSALPAARYQQAVGALRRKRKEAK